MAEQLCKWCRRPIVRGAYAWEHGPEDFYFETCRVTSSIIRTAEPADMRWEHPFAHVIMSRVNPNFIEFRIGTIIDGVKYYQQALIDPVELTTANFDLYGDTLDRMIKRLDKFLDGKDIKMKHAEIDDSFDDGVDYKRKYEATKAVLEYREAELMKLKGPCSSSDCSLHYAHSGPCDISKDKS